MNATTGEAFSTVSECHRGNIAYVQLVLAAGLPHAQSHSLVAPPASAPCRWDLLSALLDLNYLKSDAGVTRPRFARVFVPGNDWDFGYEFNLESSDLLYARIGDNFGGARLVSFDNGVKFKMFTNLLLTVDMPLIITGLFLILGMLVLYSGSLFVALLAILSFLLANFLGTATRPAPPALGFLYHRLGRPRQCRPSHLWRALLRSCAACSQPPASKPRRRRVRDHLHVAPILPLPQRDGYLHLPWHRSR